MDLYFILKHHHLADKRMNEFMLLQGKHLTPYRIDTAQRLFRLWSGQNFGKVFIANPSQHRRGTQQPPHLGKQYLFQMLRRNPMHWTRGICSAIIFLTDIINIFPAVFLDRLGKKHRSIAVAAINQSGKGFYGCGMEQMNANYLYIYDDGAWHVYGIARPSEWIGLEVTKNMED